MTIDVTACPNYSYIIVVFLNVRQQCKCWKHDCFLCVCVCFFPPIDWLMSRSINSWQNTHIRPGGVGEGGAERDAWRKTRWVAEYRRLELSSSRSSYLPSPFFRHIHAYHHRLPQIVCNYGTPRARLRKKLLKLNNNLGIFFFLLTSKDHDKFEGAITLKYKINYLCK